MYLFVLLWLDYDFHLCVSLCMNVIKIPGKKCLGVINMIMGKEIKSIKF